MNELPPANRWDIYERATPPWETGRAQPALVKLAEAGRLTGRVLDIGCGTGEHALLAASLGLDATGIDGAESAIKIARQKAIERGLVARFLVGDVLALEGLGEQFDTVIDSNLFQVFSDAERPRYVSSLASVVPAGGRFFLLCFSDHQPGREGPRRVSKAEIRESFAEGWEVERIDEVRIDIFLQGAAVIAWLADIRRR